jgi:hypothetical protein
MDIFSPFGAVSGCKNIMQSRRFPAHSVLQVAVARFTRLLYGLCGGDVRSHSDGGQDFVSTEKEVMREFGGSFQVGLHSTKRACCSRDQNKTTAAHFFDFSLLTSTIRLLH